MSARLLAHRYAGALVDLTDSSDLDQLLTSMRELDSVLSPYMDSIFTNPQISREQRLEILDRIFESQSADRLHRFCRLLVKKKRIGIFSQIVDACEDEINRRLGRKQAYVESAYSLGDQQRDLLKTQLKQVFDSDIVLDEEQKSQLLAGIRVRVDDYRMDYSIRSQLDELRSRFSKTS